MRGLILPLLGLLALGCASKCPVQRMSPGREILCYTSTFDFKQLEDSICRCTTLVHQGHDLQDLTTTGLEDLRKSLVQLNPVLQFVISINDARGRLKTSADARQEAVARILRVLNKVDGVELNVTAGTKERLVHFVQGLKNEITRKTLKKRIILALPTKSEQLAKQFDIKELSKYVDLFAIPTHYLTDEVENYKTFHPSRLMGLFDLLNTDSLVDLVHGLGAAKRKILVSLPASGYKFTLKIKDLNTPRAPAEAISPVSINQEQLCRAISQGEWTIERDEDLTAPYAFSNNSWIAFEDKISAKIKGKYVLLRDLAGLAIRDLENDLKNDCGNTITENVYNSITENRRKSREAVLTSLEDDIYSPETSYPKNLKSSDYRISRIIDSKGQIQAVRENIQTEFSCPHQGYYVHPLSCNRFYRCVQFDQHVEQYSVFEFDCPAGLAFDETTDVCVWPGSLSKGSACPGSPEIAPSAPKRFECSKEGYFADPENCQWFFACMDLGGEKMLAYEFQCPYGLVFDESKLACEWPWLVPKCAGTNYEHKGFGGSGHPGYDGSHGDGGYGSKGHGGEGGHGGYDGKEHDGGYGDYDGKGYDDGYGGYDGNGHDGGYGGYDGKGHDGGYDNKGNNGGYGGKGHDGGYGGYDGKGHDGGYDGKGHDGGYDEKGHDGGYDGKEHDESHDGKGHDGKEHDGGYGGYDGKEHDGGYDGKGSDEGYGGKGHDGGYDNKGNDGSHGGNGEKGHDGNHDGKGYDGGNGEKGHAGGNDGKGHDGGYDDKGNEGGYGGYDESSQGGGGGDYGGYDYSGYGGKGIDGFYDGDSDYGEKDKGKEDGGHNESHNNGGSHGGKDIDHGSEMGKGHEGGHEESHGTKDMGHHYDGMENGHDGGKDSHGNDGHDMHGYDGSNDDKEKDAHPGKEDEYPKKPEDDYQEKDQDKESGHGYTTINSYSTNPDYPSVLFSGYSPSSGGYSTGADHSTQTGPYRPQYSTSGYTYSRPGYQTTKSNSYSTNYQKDTVHPGYSTYPQSPIYRGGTGFVTKSSHAPSVTIYQKEFTKPGSGTTSPGLFTPGKTFPGVLEEGSTIITRPSYRNEYYPNQAGGSFTQGATIKTQESSVTSGNQFYTNEAGFGSKIPTLTPVSSIPSTGNGYYSTGFATGNGYYTPDLKPKGYTSVTSTGNDYYTNEASKSYSGNTYSNPGYTSVYTKSNINKQFKTTNYGNKAFTPIEASYPGNTYYTNQSGYNKTISGSSGTLFTPKMSVTATGNEFYPNQAGNPITNLEIPITTADDGTGYKTNEYYDNGGRGTIRYNNGLVTHKYTEEDIKDNGAIFPIYPTPDFGQTNTVSASSNGVYTRGGFTKIGPTKTGITTAQIGGTGSYVAQDLDIQKPRGKPDQIGANAFGTVPSKESAEGQDNSVSTVTPFFNVQVYNGPSVATASPAVANTYSYAKSTTPQYQENMYQYDKTSIAASAGKYSEPGRKYPTSSVGTVGYTSSPVIDYQTTVFEAARIPTVPKVKVDASFSTDAPPVPAGGYSNGNDGSLDINVSFQPTGSSFSAAEDNEVTKTGIGYEGSQDQTDFRGKVEDKESVSVESASYQSTASNEKNLRIPTFVISYTEEPDSKKTKGSRIEGHSYTGSTPNFDTKTTQPAKYPSKPSRPTVTPQINLKKPTSNYNRGIVKYTPADYDETRYSSGLSGTDSHPKTPDYDISENSFPTERNRYQSTNLPSISKSSSSFSGSGRFNSYTTNRPVTTYSNSNRKIELSKSDTVSKFSEVATTKTAVGKVIVKFSDLHPLLLGKLGAECTCKADPFAIKGNKPLLIDSSNGKVDLRNYDESDIYVDLDKSRSGDSYESYENYESQSSEVFSTKVTPVIAEFYHGRTKTPKIRVSTSGYLPASTTASSLRVSASDIESYSTRARSRSGKSIGTFRSTNSPSPSGSVTEPTNANDRASEDRIDYGEVGVLELNPEGKAECARPGLFRHPKLCNKFYACHWDNWKKKFTLHIFNCPIHLTFDNRAGACNWPTKGPACQDNNLLV
ncbi:uncharacterized protein LOC123268564 isoform X6 [Cotesia glomerata]|uniref:uncharacterized protein LOC123268564 isoform X6 n=1 Tax=Cotesia glomerata TaxID=32391 RepID=UPI001D0042E1|nr:uncharacterized protein LOC123268564 isoform X6 [Cotesia glomerata]